MNVRIIRLAAAAVLALVNVVLPAAPALAARPVMAEDLFKIAFAGEPQIAPDGSKVAFVVSRMNGPNDTYYTNLFLADVASGAVKQITTGNGDSGPQWSPDSSTIAFTRAKKGERPQIYAYHVASGTLSQLTHLKDGAGGPVFSHDGKHIAFRVTTSDAPHAAYIDFAAAGFAPNKKQRQSDVRLISEMHFESNGTGYVYTRHAHIAVMNADGSAMKTLTSGTLWSESNYQWSPDDRAIAFDSLRRATPSLGPGDIYTIAASGGAMHRVATHAPANNVLGYDRGGHLWFRSGGYLDPAEYPATVVARADGGDARTVIARNAVSYGDAVLADMGEPGGACGPFFAPGDAFAVMNVNGPGYSKLVKLDPQTGHMSDLTGATGEAAGCSMDEAGTKVAYSLTDFTHPRDIYVLDLASGQSKRLTALNDAYLSGVELSTPQPFTVKDRDGFDVQAWFMPAIGAKPGEKRPTILDIHGGPETQFGNSFFHEFQYWTSLGYNVVFSDPRGSVGFGYDFEEALAKHWGTAMFDDVQAVMDEAVKRSEVDPNRLAVLGGSYGGYATLWVIAHTHRYKTAVAERVVSNLATEQLAADLASDNALGGRYSWGLPWEAGNKYLEQSPISYVANVTTPLLILHSEEDIRTPIDQTLQEFSALKILGKTVLYVDVPGENHDLSRTGAPIHRVERLHVVAQWLAHYVQP